jgi:hypothetical protein
MLPFGRRTPEVQRAAAWPRTLKLKFEAELQGTRRARGIKLIICSNRPYVPADKLPEGGVWEIFIGIIEVWMIQDIERFHAENEMQVFINRKTAWTAVFSARKPGLRT